MYDFRLLLIRIARRFALALKTILRFLHFLFLVIVQLLSDLLFDEVFAQTFFLFTNLILFVSAEVWLIVFVVVCIVHNVNIEVFILILILLLTMVK